MALKRSRFILFAKISTAWQDAMGKLWGLGLRREKCNLLGIACRVSLHGVLVSYGVFERSGAAAPYESILVRVMVSGLRVCVVCAGVPPGPHQEARVRGELAFVV